MAAEDQTAQGKDGVGATNRPVHAGSLEPLAHDGFAACLHHSRTQKHFPFAEAGITRALGVVLEVVCFSLQIGLLTRVSRA